jgi:DNA-directed RNA polymerase subunit L
MVDIKLKVKSHQKSTNDFHNNQLNLQISGKDVNNVLVNTLRRLVMSYIPMYSFHHDDMVFDANTSIFNNDMLRDRFRNIPVLNIDNDIKTLESYDDLEIKKDRIVDKANNLTMYINIKNNKEGIQNVTTNDAVFYYKGKQIASPYKRPLLLIKLRKGHELRVTCISSLNIGLNDGIYNGSMAYHYYDEKDPKDFELEIQSSRQLDELELLNRACKVLALKCNKLEKLIISNLEKEESEDVLTKGLLKIQNENATLGNLISYYLQEQKNMEYSGYNIPFLYLNEILVRYRTDGKDIKDLIKKTFNDIRNIFKQINEDIEKL